MTPEQKDRLWELIDAYSGADVVVAISGIYGNGEPEEYDDLTQAKIDLDNFMETL